MKKGHELWYIHSIGEWETCQKRYFGSCSVFLVLQPKKHHLYSCASVDGSTLAEKTTLAQAYKCIFRPENGC